MKQGALIVSYPNSEKIFLLFVYCVIFLYQTHTNVIIFKDLTQLVL